MYDDPHRVRTVKCIRFSTDEWRLISRKALQLGMSTSEFVRHRALGTPFNDIQFGKGLQRKRAA